MDERQKQVYLASASNSRCQLDRDLSAQLLRDGDTESSVYVICYDLASKILKLPQVGAIIIYSNNSFVEFSAPGFIYQYLPKHGASSKELCAHREAFAKVASASSPKKQNPTLVAQHLNESSELVDHLKSVLTNDNKAVLEMSEYVVNDILFDSAEEIYAAKSMKQSVIFPLSLCDEDLFVFVFLSTPLLPVFLHSIHILIKTIRIFQKRKSNSSQYFVNQNLYKTNEFKDFLHIIRPLIENNFSAIAITDQYLQIQIINKQFLKMWGISNCDDILFKDLRSFISLSEIIVQNKIQIDFQQTCGRTLNGACLQVIVRVDEIKFEDKNYYVFFLEDVTGSNLIKNPRAIYHSQLSSIFDLALVGIFEINGAGECIFSNAYLDRLLGVTLSSGRQDSWLHVFDIDDQREISKELFLEIQNSGIYARNCRIQTSNGTSRWIRFHACQNQSLHGGFVGTITDETAQHHQEIRLRELAELDQLTGLVNRHVMQNRLKTAIEYVDRYGPFVIMCIDLDGFKNINDSLGHDVGDDLLVEVSKRLKVTTRKVDVIVRTGGDEFIILLANGINELAASRVANDIISAIRAPFEVKNRTLYVTVSIGLVLCKDSCTSPSTLLKRGDMALYQAKAAGRNNFQFFTPELDQVAKTKLDLITYLHEALSKQEFSVQYQPQQDASTQQFCGFEALLRWNPANGDEVSTQQFIGLLEETGLIHDVSAWMLETSFSDFSRWKKKNWVSSNQKLAVNISSSQLLLKGFIDRLEDLCQKYGLKTSDIILELNETSFMDRVKKGETVVHEIKNRGFYLAIDDFGTGYSSILALIQLKVDFLKIDTSLLRDLFSDPKDQAVVDSILAIGKRLGIEVVAVGVDHQDKIQYLKTLGCNIFQGFACSKPMSAAILEKKLFNVEKEIL